MKLLRIVGLVLGGVALAALFGLLFGWLVMILWNWLMPSLFGLTCITYWQGFGLVILAKLLFGAIGGHHGYDHHSHRARRWVAPWVEGGEGDGPDDTPERSARYREYWRTEGKAAFERFLERARGGAAEQGKA
jgi:hypothetical protein